MGGSSSKEGIYRPDSSTRWSSAWDGYTEEQPAYSESPHAQPSYGQESESYPPPPPPESYPTAQPYYAPEYAAPAAPRPAAPAAPRPAAPAAPRHEKKFDRRYSRIADSYNSLEEVTEALARAGLESSNLIVGIDFTKSNEWTGARSFHRKSLHHVGNTPNPYEHAISIIGKTLAVFDEDNLIPCFGFGDASTHDQDVFSFYDDRYCNGFEEVLTRYREIVPKLRLAGPTSFAPVIEQAMTIVEESHGQYHVLLIIADGQEIPTFTSPKPCVKREPCALGTKEIPAFSYGNWLFGFKVYHSTGYSLADILVVTRSVDTERGRLSPQEQNTVNAIVAASKLPLSIILVGVGDGPWDMMKEFDDNIPTREFDNFQFVNFTQIMSKNVPPSRKETEFALAALMEIPSQYKATLELGLLGGRKGNIPERVPLPPPVYGASSFSSSKPSRGTGFSTPSFTKPSQTTSYEPSVPPYYGDSSSVGTAPSAPSSTYDHQVCPICLTNSKDMAFGCGHQTCCDCGQDLHSCPICRTTIQTRIKLY